MNNLYKKLNKESEHIRLTADEKSAMRARLQQAFGTQAHPSDIHIVRSPYVFIFSQRWVTALASLVLVVFAGGSTAFAAQGALPGEPLYALKTNVIEQVEVALATTPAAKAKVETQIAVRRVAEAQTLAARGTLDAATTQQIEDNFNEHASRALALAGDEKPVAAMLAVDTVEMAPKQDGNRQEDARAALTFAPTIATMSVTATEATSSEEVRGKAAPIQEATSTTEATSTENKKGKHSKQESEDIHASIDLQRGILDEIKLHVSEKLHGGDTKIEHDTGDSNQNNN